MKHSCKILFCFGTIYLAKCYIFWDSNFQNPSDTLSYQVRPCTNHTQLDLIQQSLRLSFCVWVFFCLFVCVFWPFVLMLCVFSLLFLAPSSFWTLLGYFTLIFCLMFGIICADMLSIYLIYSHLQNEYCKCKYVFR